MKKPFEKYPPIITLYTPLFINGGQTLLNVAKAKADKTRHKAVKHLFLWLTQHNKYVHVYILDDKWTFTFTCVYGTAFGTMECNVSFFCEFQFICRRQ